jgi:hypothetical protein
VSAEKTGEAPDLDALAKATLEAARALVRLLETADRTAALYRRTQRAAHLLGDGLAELAATSAADPFAQTASAAATWGRAFAAALDAAASFEPGPEREAARQKAREHLRTLLHGFVDLFAHDASKN